MATWTHAVTRSPDRHDDLDLRCSLHPVTAHSNRLSTQKTGTKAVIPHGMADGAEEGDARL